MLTVMLVCICNAIREDDLREAARRGADDAEGAYAWLGKTPNCGICLDHAEDVIFEERKCVPSACAVRLIARKLDAEIRVS
jgi:bacterioferritin-associated ferredoxin